MPWMISLGVSIMLLVPSVAAAAEHLHGTVLSVDSSRAEAIVKHDPFGGMPSMTMPFLIVPRERAAQLPPGTTIDADVDRTSEPWTLRNVRTGATAPLVSSPLRHTTPVKAGDRVPEVASFVDQTGKPFRFDALRGSDVVLAFIYTRCQDARMCPLISAKFAQLQAQAKGRSVHLVEVSLDPSYDRPAVMARYGKVFGADPARWSLVVGDPDPTLDFAASFGIGAFRDARAGVIHNENTVLIDRTGVVRRMVTETAWTPGELLAEIDAFEGQGGNPVARFALWLSSAAVATCGNAVGSFSGLLDLGVVLVIFGLLAWLLFRIARGIFREAG